ncbi:hypothetical protein Tco_1354954 [Tanacetum coccineum]
MCVESRSEAELVPVSQRQKRNCYLVQYHYYSRSIENISLRKRCVSRLGECMWEHYLEKALSSGGSRRETDGDRGCLETALLVNRVRFRDGAAVDMRSDVRMRERDGSGRNTKGWA